MDKKLKAELAEIVAQVFKDQFDQAFDRKFDKKFDQAFDRNFDAKFDQAFDRKFIPMFNQGFEEVVLPEIERIRSEMATKKELKSLEEKMDNSFDNLERRMDHVAGEVEEHDIEIKNLKKMVGAQP